MRQTEQTLLEQMRITEFEVESRKALLSFSAADVQALVRCRGAIESRIDHLVSAFYTMQTSVAEIALLIGDADTLNRLRNAQRRYVLDLFGGNYDLEYINNRLRIGLVHKRIGVEPKLYLSAVHTLKGLLNEVITASLPDTAERTESIAALDRLLLFDITLVFETYIRSLVSEIETAKDKSERYAKSLEEKVRERTQQLEDLTRTDPLTGLLNRRSLAEELSRSCRTAQRRAEPICLVYCDVNDFKQINDSAGHLRGDEVLQAVGRAMRAVTRSDETCFRYGGDEFCAILPNCNEAQASGGFVARLHEAFHAASVGVTISIGIVQTGPEQFLTPDQLIREADRRMYDAKRRARAG